MVRPIRNPKSGILNRKRVAVALIEQAGKILIARRKAGVPFEHYWELPGGAVRGGESPARCVVREVREETGLTVHPEAYLGVFEHDYPQFTVEIHAYVCRTLDGEAQPLESEAIAWIGWEEIQSYRFPAANERIFDQARRFRAGCRTPYTARRHNLNIRG